LHTIASDSRARLRWGIAQRFANALQRRKGLQRTPHSAQKRTTKSRRVEPQPPTVPQRKWHPMGNLVKADDRVLAAPISLDWAWILCRRGQTPHLVCQPLQPQPQLGETLRARCQREPPPCRCTVRSRYAPLESPPHSARLDLARRGWRASTTPADQRHTDQSSAVLLEPWARKQWRMSSPDHPMGRGSARTKGHSAANRRRE